MGRDEARVDVVRVPGWERYGWMRHGFSTRAGGVSEGYGGGALNLGFTQDDDAGAVRENRRRFVHAVAGQVWPLAAVRQVHGTAVKVVARGEAGLADAAGRALVEADGLMTADAGWLLGVQAADCVPVLVADVRQRVVAAFHAGWRGTVQRIVERGIEQMRQEFGCEPADLVAAVGPAIGSCCYAVGEQVYAEFGANFGYAAELFSKRKEGLYLDLAAANRRQLVDTGLRPEAVTVVGECTGCARTTPGERKYFSHRMEGGSTGRAMGAIGIADGAIGVRP